MALPTHDELLAQLEHDPAAAGSTSGSEECPICYENIESSFTTSCKHNFCRACLKHWLRTSSTCPNCRAALCRQSRSFYLHPALQEDRHDELHEDEMTFPAFSAELRGLPFPIGNLSLSPERRTTIDREFIAVMAERYGQELGLRAAADAHRVEQERAARRLEAAFQAQARRAEEGPQGNIGRTRREEPRLNQSLPPIAREQRRDPRSMIPRHQGGDRNGCRRGR